MHVGRVVGLLVVIVIVALSYKLYFSHLQSTGTGSPAQAINVVGVKNDLIAIAQAERAYQAEHGSYASLEQLNFGGALTMVSFNIPISAFLHEVDSLVDVKDLLAGLAKAPVFAILIAGIGCLRGLQTQTGASAVGISATRAVVSAIILLVVVDGIYAFVYYLLDI